MQSRKDLICGLPAFGVIPQLHQQPRQEVDDAQAKRCLICGLPAFGVIPQLHQQPRQETDDAQGKRYLICGLPANGIKPQLHQQPLEEEDDGQGSDVEELTREQFRCSMGYLTRVELDEEDIDPMFRRLVQNLRNQERNSGPMKRPKQEQGESSRGKARRRD